MCSEKIVEPMITEHFHHEVSNTKLTRGKYCPYDYESKDLKTRYELKSRKNKHSQFPTILISQSKITKGIKGCDKLILLFLFTDGLYYIQYDELTFSVFDIGAFSRYRDGKDENDTVVHIPIKNLTRIDL